MTFFSPPLPLPLPYDARAADQRVVRNVDSAMLPYGRMEFDLVIGTNAILAPSKARIAYLGVQNATADGSVYLDMADRHHGAAVAELRSRTGMSYAELARYVGVERRSLYFWLEGRPISSENSERLARLLDLVRRVDVGNPSDTSKALAVLSAPSPEAPVSDRYADYRVQEGDAAARLPYFDVATLIGGARADERDVRDDGDKRGS